MRFKFFTKRCFAAITAAAVLIAGGCQPTARIKRVQDAIEALPTEYTEETDKLIEEAEHLYSILDVNEKYNIDRKKLSDLEKARVSYFKNAAENVNRLIDDLDTDCTDIGSGLNKVNASLAEIVSTIEETPKGSDIYIDYQLLIRKQEDITKKVNKITDRSIEGSEYSKKVLSEYSEMTENYVQAMDQIENNSRGAAYLSLQYSIIAMKNSLDYYEKAASISGTDASTGRTAAENIIKLLKDSDGDPTAIDADLFTGYGKSFLDAARGMLQEDIETADDNAEIVSEYVRLFNDLMVITANRGQGG